MVRRVLTIWLLLFGSLATASTCYPGLAKVGAYVNEPAEVADRVAERVTSATFSFSLPSPVTWKQGDKVDVTFGKRPVEGETPKAITSAMALAQSGIFVGTSKNSKGVEEVILDRGRGRFTRIPVEKIRSMVPSTATLKPSTGTMAESLYARARAVKVIATELVKPAANRLFAQAFPGALGLYFSYETAKMGIEWGSQMVHSNPYESAAAAAIGITGLYYSPNARKLAKVALQVPYLTGKGLAGLGMSLWSLATNYRGTRDQLAMGLTLSKLLRAGEGIAKISTPGGLIKVGKVEGLGHIG